MRGDVQEELTTVACVHQLGIRRSPQREPTMGEGPGVKCRRLLAILSLFANKLDGIELFEFTFRDGKNRCSRRETVSNRRKTVALFVLGLGAGCIVGCIVVPE
jgi:hypothetical protein